jgi:hypothetical protein
MTTRDPLRDRLRAYAAVLDGAAPPITADEVHDRVEDGVVVRRGRIMPVAVAAVIVAALVSTVGVVALVRSDGSDRPAGVAGYQEPDAPATSVLEVEALPSLRFQADEFVVPAGVVEIRYIGRGGTHTLVIDDPRFAGFKLAVNGTEVDIGKVRLDPGVYTISDEIPGHADAGMQAILRVVNP